MRIMLFTEGLSAHQYNLISFLIPKALVDFWLGHAIGDMAEAYKRPRLEEAKAAYLEREAYLSISVGEGVEELRAEIERKVRVEVDQRGRELQGLVNGLTSENLELRRRVSGLEAEVQTLHEKWKAVDAATRELLESKAQIIAELRKHGLAVKVHE